MRGEIQIVGDSEHIALYLSRTELLLLAGSVNETIEAVDEWEFSIRLGATKDEARELRAYLHELISGLPPE